MTSSPDARTIQQPTPEELRERLAELRAARGFLLPHHGVMAAAMPDLHRAYLDMYRAVTLTERRLTPIEKEIVWLAILVTTGESIGTHHLELFRKAGGDTAMAASVIRLAGYAPVFDALSFADGHWRDYLPGLDAQRHYRDGFDRLRDGVPAAAAELALLAVQTARGKRDAIAYHIRSCYELGVAEEAIAEALGYLMWPCGVNVFLEACTIWHELIRAKEVDASPLFAVWGEMEGLGAYDPALGGAGPGAFDRD
jgi:alkylhydroperoxidase/carboxymuconolactone decarboxylase family protein YurZ